VVRGKVIIGNSGAELGVRGYVSAYDADSGKLVWRFYTVPGNPADGPDTAASDEAFARFAGKTWNGKWWEMGGGGTVWDAIVYDPEFDQLLIGVGNGSPWNHRARSAGKGDNLFLSSILALDPDTGAYKWHYQENPAEMWDFTATQQITLADLTIDGKSRKVLMQAPKNGFFYVIDRANGKLISAEAYAPQNWAERIDLATGRPVERPEARYADAPHLQYPSGIGAHAWMPMSYSPQTGLVYIPAMHVPLSYADDVNYTRHIGRWNTGVSFLAPPEGSVPGATALERRAALAAMNKGMLVAWDPVRRRRAGRSRCRGRGTAARWRPRATCCSRAIPTAFSAPARPTPARSCGASTRSAGSWPARSPSAPAASSTSRCSPATAARWAWRPRANGCAARRPTACCWRSRSAARARSPGCRRRAAAVRDQQRALHARAARRGRGAVLRLLHDLPQRPGQPDLLPLAGRGERRGVASVVFDGALADNGMIAFKPWLSADRSRRCSDTCSPKPPRGRRGVSCRFPWQPDLRQRKGEIGFHLNRSEMNDLRSCSVSVTDWQGDERGLPMRKIDRPAARRRCLGARGAGEDRRRCRSMPPTGRATRAISAARASRRSTRFNAGTSRTSTEAWSFAVRPTRRRRRSAARCRS
jgi:hypothetical protein